MTRITTKLNYRYNLKAQTARINFKINNSNYKPFLIKL